MDTDKNGGHNKEPPTNPQGSDVNQMGNQRGQSGLWQIRSHSWASNI
jgi:hypothetical protein